jgi:hypothetical protein
LLDPETLTKLDGDEAIELRERRLEIGGDVETGVALAGCGPHLKDDCDQGRELRYDSLVMARMASPTGHLFMVTRY